MVQVTEAARRLLLDNLTRAFIPPDTGYRLTPTKDGFRLRLDGLSKKDLVVREGDRVLLLVEADLDKQLDGMVLDLGDDGGRLVLERAAEDQSESKD
jgi:hypothetical protein